MPLVAQLFRGMKQDVDGKPVVESTKRGLGVKVGSVRPEEDDMPVDEMGSVQPGTGGMSVSADLHTTCQGLGNPRSGEARAKTPSGLLMRSSCRPS